MWSGFQQGFSTSHTVSLLRWPFEALTGEVGPTLALSLLALLSFLGDVRMASGPLLLSAMDAASTVPARQYLPVKVSRFDGPLWRKVLVKEWKLIARDPNLIAQTLLQLLYLLPLLWLALKAGEVADSLPSAVAVLAATLVGSLAQLTLTAEDAPDLLVSAPVRLQTIRLYKLLAALLPVWLLTSPVLMLLLWQQDWSRVMVFTVCVGGATCGAGVTQLWYPRKGHSRELRQRCQQSFAITLVDLFSIFAWASIAYGWQHGQSWAWFALPAAAAAPATAWMRGRTRRAQGLLV